LVDKGKHKQSPNKGRPKEIKVYIGHKQTLDKGRSKEKKTKEDRGKQK
jgi:hypothetical protein